MRKGKAVPVVGPSRPQWKQREDAYVRILECVDRELAKFDDVNREILIEGLIREIKTRSRY